MSVGASFKTKTGKRMKFIKRIGSVLSAGISRFCSKVSLQSVQRVSILDLIQIENREQAIKI